MKECLKIEKCKNFVKFDKDCRYHTNLPECEDCLLHIDRKFTLEEIGKTEDLTRERIRQIEEEALVKFSKRFKKMFGEKFITIA